MCRESDALEELCLLTGQVSTDTTYLYYLLIKDSPYKEEIVQNFSLRNENTVESLEAWFSKL